MRHRDDLIFPMDEFRTRLANVRSEMERRELDVMMITSPQNIFYLTGFETTGYASFQTLIVPIDREPFMIVRMLENTGVTAFTWIEISRTYSDGYDPIVRVKEVLHDFGLTHKRIGYERDCFFFTAPQQEELLDICRETDWVPASDLVDGLRVIKSELELVKIRTAARYAEIAQRAGKDVAAVGIRDTRIAAAMHNAMYRAGSDYPAVAPFVATGTGASIGHATWQGRTLQPGDCVFLEVAGCVDRYHAAMMRTGWIGKPDARVRDAEKVCIEALEATLDAIKAGRRVADVDKISREIIGTSGIGLMQMTRSAYSIGIAFAPDWGEGGIISFHPREERLLQENMVFHVIPWGLIPGEFAMGFSETVRVTADGCEVLTNLPRRLFVESDEPRVPGMHVQAKKKTTGLPPADRSTLPLHGRAGTTTPNGTTTSAQPDFADSGPADGAREMSSPSPGTPPEGPTEEGAPQPAHAAPTASAGLQAGDRNGTGTASTEQEAEASERGLAGDGEAAGVAERENGARRKGGKDNR